MKCPFCDSKHTARNGYDDDSMDIWKCMACGETFTQADLDKAKKDRFDNLLFGDENSHLDVSAIKYDADDDFDQSQLRLPGDFRVGDIYF